MTQRPRSALRKKIAESAQFSPDQKLAAAGLDVQFTAAQANHLVWRDQIGRERQALDFTSAEGASLLGHNHPELVAMALRHFHERRPCLLQAGRPCRTETFKGLLAERIGRETKQEYEVVLLGSAVQALEAAVEHARVEFARRQNKILGLLLAGLEREELRQAFFRKNAAIFQHPGHVLAWGAGQRMSRIAGVRVIRAANLAGSPGEKGEHVLHNPAPEPPFVAPDSFSTVACIVLEPIDAESGVHEMEDHLVRAVLAFRAAHPEVPIIVDETRTAFGRTGRFSEGAGRGLPCDYLIAGAALGGGIAHLTALAIERTRYRSDPWLWQSYALVEDEYSSGVGTACLATIDRDRIIERCATMGLVLRAQLESVARAWPAQVAAVRGRGLLFGVEFHEQRGNPSPLLRALDRQRLLTPMIAGFLLHRHDVRVLPSARGHRVLHIEPSAYIDSADVSRLTEGLLQACAVLDAGDAFSLMAHLVRPWATQQPLRIVRAEPIDPSSHSSWSLQSHVGLIGDHVDAEHWARFDPSLARFRLDELARLFERLSPFVRELSGAGHQEDWATESPSNDSEDVFLSPRRGDAPTG